MNWDSYVDSGIAATTDSSGTTHMDKMCIIGLDGGAMLTSNTHPNAFKLSASEASAIAEVFKSRDFTLFQTSGIHAEGIKYVFLREDGKVAFGKKKGVGSITLRLSKTAVFIGHCPEGGQQGNLNIELAIVADYLESVGM